MRNPFAQDTLLSLMSAPIIWGAHFVICYVLVSLACAYNFGGVSVGIGIVTVVALALLGYTALVNYRKWTNARRANTGGTDMQAFFSLNSMMLTGLSAVALIWVAFPTVLLPPCAT